MTTFEQNSDKNANAWSRSVVHFDVAKLDMHAPIQNIANIATMLAESDLDARQRTFVQMISRSANILSATMRDVTDLSKINAGNLLLVPAPINLCEIVENLELDFAAQAQDKSLGFSVEIQSNLPLEVMGDEKRVGQIIEGLLANAIKYSERGDITLRIHGDCVDQNADLTIEVEDTGIGMDEAHMQAVLGLSSEDIMNADVLRLSIVRSLVALMDGTLEIESLKDHGTLAKVALTLPLQPISCNLNNEIEALEGLRLFVLAEDDAANKALVSELNAYGLDACLIGDGAIASLFMQAAGKMHTTVDLIVCDQKLLGEHIEKAAHEDALAAFPKIRTILFAGADQLSETDCSALEGYATCLIAPIDSEMIVEAISELVNSKSQDNTKSVLSVVPEPIMRAEIIPPSLAPSAERLMTPFEDFIEIVSTDVVEAETTPETSLERLLVQSTSSMPIEEIKIEPSGLVTSQVDVLIAEDNEINQLVYRQILSDIDVSHQVVDDAETFMNIFYTLNPRVVVLDISLPDASGFDVAQTLRELGDQWALNVPIIGVVAPGKGENLDACLEARMDDCLAKPISPNTLISKIEYWLERSANQSVA